MKIKRTGLILIGLTIAFLTNGQTIKIQGGTSISKLDWVISENYQLYEEALIGYSFFAGLDYFDKEYFNFSSNIGVISRGGKDELQLTDQSGEPLGQKSEKPSLNYLSINTTIDIKYQIKETFSPFISFDPRFDYLISSSNHFETIEELDGLENTMFGLILGGGLKYYISNFQLGLRADYYLDFTKVADWTIENTGNGGEVSVNTFTINLTIGYRLK